MKIGRYEIVKSPKFHVAHTLLLVLGLVLIFFQGEYTFNLFSSNIAPVGAPTTIPNLAVRLLGLASAILFLFSLIRIRCLDNDN